MEVNPTCRWCNSSSLRSFDKVIATADVADWGIAQGKLAPYYHDGSEVDWNSQEPVDPATPWECGDCGEKLSTKDLISTLTPEHRAMLVVTKLES